MTLMARTIGIPARVAIGFLQPARIGKDTYVYSAHDMHAWPELYFQGAGWCASSRPPPNGPGPCRTTRRTAFQVKTTPRCPSATASADDTTSPRDKPKAPGSDNAAAPPQAAPRASPAGGAPLSSAPQRSRCSRCWSPSPGSCAVAGASADWATDRARLARAARHRRGSPARWPAGRSPRETGIHLSQHFGPPEDADRGDRPRPRADAPEAARALERVVSRIELARYARPGREEAAVLTADAWTVIAALEGGVTSRTRRRADWLPRSLLGFRSRPPATSSSTGEDLAHARVIDHAGV